MRVQSERRRLVRGRVEQAAQALGAYQGEAERHRLAARRRQRQHRRLSEHRSAEPVRHDQAAILGYRLARKILRDREVESVAKLAVFGTASV